MGHGSVPFLYDGLADEFPIGFIPKYLQPRYIKILSPKKDKKYKQIK